MTHPLLTPRYMVEADYPNSPFRVGDVLTFEYGKFTSTKNVSINERDVKQYPHIFRLMHWSAGRKLEEMPRWVRFEEMIVEGAWVPGEETGLEFHSEDAIFFSIALLTPATEAEYLTYLKSKEK